jgi:hypothetical protein
MSFRVKQAPEMMLKVKGHSATVCDVSVRAGAGNPLPRTASTWTTFAAAANGIRKHWSLWPVSFDGFIKNTQSARR